MTAETLTEEFDAWAAQVRILYYKASDFYPRGTFRGRVNPPYPLSEVPEEYSDPREVVRRFAGASWVKQERSSWEMEQRWTKNHPGEGPTPEMLYPNDFSLDQRIYPEQIDPRLILDNFRRIFPQGLDREAVVLLVQNRGNKNYTIVLPQWNFSFHPGFFDGPGVYHPSATTEVVKTGVVGEVEEVEEVSALPVARDSGYGEYGKTTESFRQKMLWVDRHVEEILKDKIPQVSMATESIRRLAKRRGRVSICEQLVKVRHGDEQAWQGVVAEMTEDIHIANQLALEPGVPDRGQELERAIKIGLKTLFAVESAYLLNAVIALPWNQIGAEPFDTLINVLWFRFNYRQMTLFWKMRRAVFQAITSDHFAKAALTRKQILSELSSNSECAGELGPVAGFVDWGKLRVARARVHKYYELSDLTRLLWSSLKYAQPVQWRSGSVTSLSRGFDDNGEYQLADTALSQQGDYQGRLTLAGESLPKPLGSIEDEAATPGELAERHLAIQLDELGVSYDRTYLKGLARRVVSQETDSPQLTVRQFTRLVAGLKVGEIKRFADTLKFDERLAFLHRLGYSVSREITRGPGIDGEATVVWVITNFFAKSTRKYYDCIRRINAKMGQWAQRA